MLVVMTLAAAPGCGGRSSSGVRDGAGGGPDARADMAPPQGKCVIAVHVDNCCYPAVAVPEGQLKKDPCLVFYPPRQIPAACKNQWPAACFHTSCTNKPPPTRLANPSAGGGCAWGNECNVVGDCRLAVDARNCCQCARAFPKVLVASEDCIVDLASSKPAPDRCRQHCGKVKCKPCGKLPAVSCVASAIPGLNVCAPTSL